MTIVKVKMNYSHSPLRENFANFMHVSILQTLMHWEYLCSKFFRGAFDIENSKEWMWQYQMSDPV